MVTSWASSLQRVPIVVTPVTVKQRDRGENHADIGDTEICTPIRTKSAFGGRPGAWHAGREGGGIAHFQKKKAAVIIKKVLESAIANAEHNEGADIDELKVSEILVDVGPSQKRWRARARGRVNHIIKRTSHIRVTVSDA